MCGACTKKRENLAYKAGFSLVVTVGFLCVAYIEKLRIKPKQRSRLGLSTRNRCLLVSLWSCWSMWCVVYVGDLGVPTRPTVFTLVVLLRRWTVTTG